MARGVQQGCTEQHQGARPRWFRREHARTGADNTPGPRPVTLSRRAARCWIVGGRLPLRGCRGPGQSVAPQSSCPGSSWRHGSHLPNTSTGLLARLARKHHRVLVGRGTLAGQKELQRVGSRVLRRARITRPGSTFRKRSHASGRPHPVTLANYVDVPLAARFCGSIWAVGADPLPVKFKAVAVRAV